MDVTTSSLNWEWYNQLSSVTQASKLYNWGSFLNIWVPYAEMSQSLPVLALAGPFWPAVGCSAPPLLLFFLSTATSALSCCCGQRTQRRWGSAVSVALWEGATAGWGSGKRYTAAAAGLADGEPVIGAHPLLSPFSTMGPAFAPSLFFSLPQLPSPYSHRALTLCSSYSHQRHVIVCYSLDFSDFPVHASKDIKLKNYS